MKWTLIIFLTAAAAAAGRRHLVVACRASRVIRIRDGRITSDERRA